MTRPRAIENAGGFGRGSGDHRSRFAWSVRLLKKAFGEPEANLYPETRRKDRFRVNSSKQTIGRELSRDTFWGRFPRFCSIFERKNTIADFRLNVRLLDTLSRVIFRVTCSKQSFGVHATRHCKKAVLRTISVPKLEVA